MAIIYYEDLKSRKIIKDKFDKDCKKLLPSLYFLKEENIMKNEILEFCKNEKLAVCFKNDPTWTNFMDEEPIFKISKINSIFNLPISNTI
jgi:hypothetical protein